MSTNSQHTTQSCMVVGFVSIDNLQRNVSPVRISDSNFYTPVKYPGILTEHATSESDCSRMIKLFTILFGVIIFLVQIVQVKIKYYAIIVVNISINPIFY